MGVAQASDIVVPTPFVLHDLIFIVSGYAPIQPIYAIRSEARGDISRRLLLANSLIAIEE